VRTLPASSARGQGLIAARILPSTDGLRTSFPGRSLAMPTASLAPHRALASTRGWPDLGAEDGQALVEAAFVLPALIFLLLCAVQLTQLQQARLMVEYAAFCAARVGIVRDLDNGKADRGEDGPMHDAAVFALLPTFGRADSTSALALTRLRFEKADALLRPLGLAQVRVSVLNPRRADFAAFGGHLDGREIDFDDARPLAAPANLLSLRVRYLYELKVPFAGRFLQALWFAAKVGRFGPGGLEGFRGADLTGPRAGSQKGPDAVVLAQSRALALGVLQDGMPGGLNLTTLSGLARHGRFFLPVDAWHTMRMQSNPFLRWAAP
jgi:hypothetical protein